MTRPMATTTTKLITPGTSSVCRKASAISTGMKVPEVFSPTRIRITTTTRAPTGSSMMSLNMLCSAMGRLYRDRANPGVD